MPRPRRNQQSPSAPATGGAAYSTTAPHTARIRIVLADDHAHFRTNLRNRLQQESDLTIVGEATTPAEAVSACESHRPHVLLLDVAMTGGRGTEVLENLRPLALGVRIVLLTTGLSRPEMVRALQLGAHGVVLKETPPELLVKSVRCVRAGEFWIGRDMVADLVQALASPEPRSVPGARLRAPRTFALTPRELEIVAAVASGYTNRQMAEKFGVAEDTIKHHLTSIFDKTGVSNRLELALFAIHHRLASTA